MSEVCDIEFVLLVVVYGGFDFVFIGVNDFEVMLWYIEECCVCGYVFVVDFF